MDRDKSAMQLTLGVVYEHIEPDDPQPGQILITPGNVTMQMATIDDLLEWCDTIEANLDDHTPLTYVAQLLWKQAEDQPAPTVITAEYEWNEDVGIDTTFRVVASSPLTMDQLANADMDDRIEVIRSDVENLMIQGHAHKAGLTFEPL